MEFSTLIFALNSRKRNKNSSKGLEDVQSIVKPYPKRWGFSLGPGKNNLDKIALRFGSDLDVTIEKKPRHSTAMLRLFRLKRVHKVAQRWDGIFSNRPLVRENGFFAEIHRDCGVPSMTS